MATVTFSHTVSNPLIAKILIEFVLFLDDYKCSSVSLNLVISSLEES